MSQGASSGDEHEDNNALESLLANQQFLSVAMRRQILKQMVSTWFFFFSSHLPHTDTLLIPIRN